MLVFQAIVPIFLLVALGYLLCWRGWLPAETVGGLSTMTFKLFMPTLLFTGIARADLGAGLDPVLLLAYVAPLLAVFVLVNLWVHRRRGRASPLGLAASYSNNVLIGIPLVTALLGADRLVYLFAVLVFHSLALFSLQSLYVALGTGQRVEPRGLLKSLFNPIINGLLLGALVNVLGLELPAALWQTADWLAAAALPCALMVLGMGLSRYRFHPSTAVFVLTGLKLLAFPALVWWLGALLGLAAPARAVLLLMAACPTGVNVLAFATTPEDTRTLGSQVFLSTVLALLSLPLWMSLAG